MPTPSQAHQFLLLPENRSADRALQTAFGQLSQKRPKLLFLYGPSGVGKSHLITQAIREHRKQNPKLKMEHLTASDFAARLADASAAETIPEFQSKFRKLDLFVCEDLQALRGRKESQRQLVVCLDELAAKGSLVILTSTTLPGSWTKIDRRLIDRCRGGLSIELPLPSPKNRIKLCRHFAQMIHEPMSSAIAEMIANHVEGSPRDLKSTVERLVEDAHHRQQSLTPSYVQQYLQRELSTPEVSLKKIIQVTAKYFGLKIRDLKSTARRADIVYARQSAMYLARELTSHSQLDIAKALGKADHTSVIRACRKIEESLSQETRVRQEISELKTLLKSA